jgi:hypothetical protein
MAVTKNQFFKVYLLDVQSGRFSGWSKAELLTWISLKAHEDFGLHVSFPGYKTIQRETGLSSSQIRKAILKLQEKGVVNYESGASAKKVNFYEFPDR